MTHHKGSLIGGIFLVAGTTIGGGMLALPVLTSLGGFIPSLCLFAACWLFMACTGLLYLETAQWAPKDSNIITMAETTLGLPGKAAAWGVYLFLFYCLTLAYMVGCGNLMSQALPIPDWFGPLLFTILFAPIVFAGARTTGIVNLACMFGIAVFFAAFLVLGYRYVQTNLLLERNWPMALFALPVAFTSFGFQGIIPTLYGYLDHDVQKTKKAILIGSAIPLFVYIIWQWLILGIVPAYGEGGLVEAMHKGDNAVQPLKVFIHNPNIYFVGQYFAFFALVTSFFGVTLGLVDFMADGLKVKKTKKGKFWLSLLVFIPPLVLAMLYPRTFLIALDFAGGFGAALLLGLLPIIMVWSGRYRLKLPESQMLPGGKFALLIMIAFVLFEIGFELFHQLSKWT